MKRIFPPVIGILCLMQVAVGTASAQGGGVRWGPSVGLLMPLGDYADRDGMGWVVGLGVTKWTGGVLGIRVDGSYGKTTHDEGGGNTTLLGGMGSLVYALGPDTSSLRPVVNAGVGLYSVDAGSGSETKLGFGLGGALLLKLGSGSTRVVFAMRFTSVAADPSLTFISTTLGLSLGM